MKKILSILLSVLLLLSTMTVLTILPAVATTPTEPVNLIVNGNASGVDTNGDGVLELYYTADDVALNTYTGQRDLNAPRGWRDLNATYGNVGILYPKQNTAGTVPDGYFSNCSDNITLRLNRGQYMVQDIVLEAGKTYKISAKMAHRILTEQKESQSMYMFVDAGIELAAATKPTNTAWIAEKVLTFTPTGITKTNADESITTYYGAGDFTDHSIIVNADEFATANNLTATDGKYNARLVFHTPDYGSAYSNSGYFDDITMYEVYNITADKGGCVNTNAVYVNTTATLTATPYYGNSFKGWYKGNELVSTEPTLTTLVTSDLTAKFNVYNLIEDGSFISSEIGDSAPLAMSNRVNAHATFIPTFEVVENNTGIEKFGNKILKYTNVAAANNATNAQRDISIPVTVKKNTKYLFRFSVQNNYPIYTGFAVKTAVAWSNHATISNSFLVTRSTTGGFYNNSYGYDSRTNVVVCDGNSDLRTYNAAMNQTTKDDAPDSTWYDVELIFDSLENEGTLYFVLGIKHGAKGTVSHFANMQISELTDTPAHSKVIDCENGKYTVNRADSYLNEEIKYVITPHGTSTGVAYSDTLYTLADTGATTATASSNTGYRFTGWYSGEELVSENATIDYATLTKNNLTPKFEIIPTYTITASAEKNADGVYGGYVINKSQVINEAENVTVNAVTYAGNTFEGWYNGETKVSSNESYTFTVASDVDLVAKWNVKNIWPDSGYENTEIGVQQISHRNPDGMWHSAGTPWNWGYAAATTDYKYTGNASMAVTHRHNEVSAKLSVEPNTDYELSFNWLLGNSQQQGSTDPSFLKSVLIRGWDSSQIGYTDVTTYYSAEFQNTKVIFNSGDNNEVFIGFSYFAGSKPIYFDDVCLVPYDKETGTTDYFRVTYDFGVEEMENATEYVKAGEYNLRAHNFFFREPISVDFVNYTVNGETKAAGDVITVDGDVTVYLNYKAHDYGDMLTDTTSFGNDYELVLAALPDPQKLLVHHTDYYGMIGDWLLSKKNDISGIIALGDLTEYGAWPQYEAVYDTFKDVVAEIPFGVSLGNHDYPGGNGKGDWAENYEKEYNTIIYDHFFKDIIVDSLLANNGGAYPYTNVATDKYEAMSKDATVDSVEHTYYIYNDEYLVISLGIFPRNEVLDWADALAKANADKKVIVTTHSHIGRGGQILDDDDTYAIAKNETTNGGTVVREKLLETNPNIVMMVCGHASSTNTIYNRNVRADGTTYYEVLIDNQDDDENWQGVGNVTLLGFKDDGTVDFTTYSTVQQAYFNSANNEFSIELGAHRNSDVVEDVEENTVIDTSAVDTNDYFIPYGSVYHQDAEGNFVFADKNEDGSFTAPVSGKFGFTGFKKPSAGRKLITFGASTHNNDGTVQYGSYVPTIEEGTTYGTMYITGDWEAFIKYYQNNKSWTVDEIVAKVSAMYDNKIANFDGYVPISAGEDIAIFVYKKDQKNHMYANENGILEYALRVVGLAADRICTAVGYAKTENGCEFSENIISTSYNALKEIN